MRPPEPPPPYNGPPAGVLKYAGPPVVQNGEVVFAGLPNLPLRLSYDAKAWDHRLLPQRDGTQKLVMRSLKPGKQSKCEVRWEIER